MSWYRVRSIFEDWFGPVVDFCKFVVFMICMVVILGGLVSPLVYETCKRNAKIINEEFGTSYTTADIFWTGGTIESLVLGRKARIDLTDER